MSHENRSGRPQDMLVDSPSHEPETRPPRRHVVPLLAALAAAMAIALVLFFMSTDDEIVNDAVAAPTQAEPRLSELDRFIVLGRQAPACSAQALSEALGTTFLTDDGAPDTDYFADGIDEVERYLYRDTPDDLADVIPDSVTALLPVDTSETRETVVARLQAENIGAELLDLISRPGADQPALIGETWAVGNVTIETIYERDAPQRLAWIEWQCG